MDDDGPRATGVHDDQLTLVRRVATEHGVSRLADVTGLDRIGVPVWQAFRPWSRSLSVHQGKALGPRGAMLGGCMEAIECAHAEDWRGEVRLAGFADLPPGERSPSLDDHADTRGALGPSLPIAWTRAERLGRKGHLWVPEASVSLDMTREDTLGIERSSNGQGAGFTLERASLKALCELIERDAFAAWQASGPVGRALDAIDRASIEHGWFRAATERLDALGIGVRVFALPAVIPVPVIAVELIDPGPEAVHYPSAGGTCAHPDAEIALCGAFCEAAQARLTTIAGARDDIPLGASQSAAPALGLALAPPPGYEGRDFGALFGYTPQSDAATTLDAIIAALARVGYPDAARIVLSPPASPVITVKLFAPGLGALGRARR